MQDPKEKQQQEETAEPKPAEQVLADYYIPEEADIVPLRESTVFDEDEAED